MKGKMGKKVEEYDAQGTTAAKEAEDTTDDFNKGGKVKRDKKKEKKKEHKVHGEEAKHRMDRPKRASGGRVGHSPFSSASKTSGGVGDDNHSKDLPASDMNFNTAK